VGSILCATPSLSAHIGEFYFLPATAAHLAAQHTQAQHTQAQHTQAAAEAQSLHMSSMHSAASSLLRHFFPSIFLFQQTPRVLRRNAHRLLQRRTLPRERLP